MRPNQAKIAAGLAALLLLPPASGCGGGDAAPGTPGAPSATGGPPAAGGTITVDGSSTVFRISKAAQERFASVNPDVTVVVNNSGTGGGFSKYLSGEVDIVDASRAAKSEEEAKAKAQGIDWTRFLVGYDGITVVINPKNDFVKTLTVAQLKGIWIKESTVKTWKDVDPSWPDRKLILYSPDNDSGTFDFFTEAINGKSKNQREDVTGSADDNTLVTGVAGDADALGYFGYAYFAANASKLKAVAIQAGDKPAVMPTPATILDKTYTPLSRPLYIYVKQSALRRPEVAQFVKYYLDNVGELATRAKYVSPTDEDKAANAAAMQPAGEKPAARAE